MNARSEGDSRRFSKLAAHMRRVALAAAVAVAVWAIAAKWPQVRIALGQMSLPALSAAAAASFAYVALTMLSWQAVIGIPLSAASRIFFVSQIAKYLPGGVWNFVAVGESARGYSISRRRSVSSLAVAVAISIVVGAMLALPCLLAAEDLRSRYWWLLAAVPLGVAVLWPSILNRCLNAALRLARREPLERPVAGRSILRSAFVSLLAWLAIGLQVYILLTALGMEAGAAGLARSIGGYALGWTAGFLVFFVPAGVGVREVALGAALAGAVEPVLAAPRKLLADFPQSERLLEGDRPLFEADDYFDEPRPGLLIADGVDALEGPVVAAMAFAADACFALRSAPFAGPALFALGLGVGALSVKGVLLGHAFLLVEQLR